jgi:hypothetical protein
MRTWVLAFAVLAVATSAMAQPYGTWPSGSGGAVWGAGAGGWSQGGGASWGVSSGYWGQGNCFPSWPGWQPPTWHPPAWGGPTWHPPVYRPPVWHMPPWHPPVVFYPRPQPWYGGPWHPRPWSHYGSPSLSVGWP